MKKLLSLILAVMMVISAFSVTALADGMNALDLAPIGEAAAPAEEPAEEPVLEEPEQPVEEAQEELAEAVTFAADETLGMEGEGTKENPYIIRTSENLKTISVKCKAVKNLQIHILKLRMMLRV